MRQPPTQTSIAVNLHRSQDTVAPITIADLPDQLLYDILAKVRGIQKLKTRATLALVSKAFSRAVKRSHSLTFTSSNLVATKTTFCEATFCGLLATIGHISTLQLQFVDAHNLERMIIVACCCTALQSLTVHVKARKSHSSLGEDELKLCTCLWWVLHSKELSMIRETQSALSCAVVSGKRTLLAFEKLTTMPILDHKQSLATITAGSLHALHMLALAFAQDLQDLLLSNPPRVSDLDAAMLNLMPALKSKDIHNQPFFASFSGIMQGQLSRRTANTLYQAEVVHCMGLAEAVRSLRDLKPVLSIKRWTNTSARWLESGFINYIAPNLLS